MSSATLVNVPALEFETERLRVRSLCDLDKALFCGLYTNAETMRFIAEPLSPERAARAFHRNLAAWQDEPLQCAFLTVLHKATERAIGICALTQFDPQRTRAEVGIMLDSDSWSRGYAREGLGGLVKQVFAAFSVEEIWVRCSATNPVVERMVGSIGFALSDHSNFDAGPLLQRTWSVRRPS